MSDSTLTRTPDPKPVQHGHMDPEANPDWESNVTIHGHVGGGESHRHRDEPWWGATGTRYVWPSWAQRILDSDYEPGAGR